MEAKGEADRAVDRSVDASVRRSQFLGCDSHWLQLLNFIVVKELERIIAIQNEK